jgi:hypothetical protein
MNCSAEERCNHRWSGIWSISSVWGVYPIANNSGCGIDKAETTLTRLGGESCGTTRSGPSWAARFFTGPGVSLPGWGGSMAASSPHSGQRLRSAELRPVETVERHKSKAEQRHDEAAGHIIFVGDGAHHFDVATRFLPSFIVKRPFLFVLMAVGSDSGVALLKVQPGGKLQDHGADAKSQV